MNIDLSFIPRLLTDTTKSLAGILNTGLSRAFNEIQVSWQAQHNTDNTHGNVTANSVSVAHALNVTGVATVGAGGTSVTPGVININGGSGAHSYASIDFYLNSVLKGFIVAVESAGDFAPNAASGDLVIRAQNQKILFSADNGTSNPLVVTGAKVGIGTAAPTGVGGGTVLVQVNSATYLDNLMSSTLGTSGAPVTGTHAIFVRTDIYESLSDSDASFTEGFGVFNNQKGGSGSRCGTALWQLVTAGARTGATLTQASIELCSGSVALGTYFGGNPYVQLLTGAAGVTSAVGEEINTDVQVAITGLKVGLQIVDKGTSTGAATGPNVALRLVNEFGAYGFQQGLFFEMGDGVNTGNSVRTTGNLIASSGGSYGKGVDFGACTFGGAGMVLPNTSFYAARDSIGVDSGLMNLDAVGIVNIGGSTSAGANAATAGVSLIYGRLGFPSSANPSTNVNVLDQYQEGTWTPTDASGGSLTLTVHSATYVKIGQLVWITLDVTFPVTADTHNVTIGGLPFTAGASPCAVSQGYGAFANQWYVPASTTTLAAYHAGTVTPTTNISLSTLECVVGGCYRASA